MCATNNRAASADDGTIYSLIPDEVYVGDVVLSAGSGIISWGIRKSTGSEFSHAALCTRPGMLLEAVAHGVMRRSVLATYVSRRKWIKVLRPNFSVVDQDTGRSLAHCAEALYGRGYSGRGAVASRFPRGRF